MAPSRVPEATEQPCASVTFTIRGAPRTKKNHGIIATKGRPRMLPSPQFSAWNRIAQMELARFRCAGFRVLIGVSA